jgi:ERCC4-type nuclease
VNGNGHLPTELKPEQVVAVIDSREKLPYDLAPLRSVTGSLRTGDYSVRGLEHVIAIERKSASDLLTCIGQDRKRFDAEVKRLLAFPVRGLVCECSWYDLENNTKRRKVTPQAAVASVLGWCCQGLPVVMAGNRDRAARFVARMLFVAARRRWRELRILGQSVLTEEARAE